MQTLAWLPCVPTTRKMMPIKIKAGSKPRGNKKHLGMKGMAGGPCLNPQSCSYLVFLPEIN